MDIEEFYDEDPRRRASDESEFGREWRDVNGHRYELSWVHDTGELYAMVEPPGVIVSDGLGDENMASMPTELLQVEVLGTYATADEVQRLLAGWPDAMAGSEGFLWVRGRVQAGVPTGDGGDVPADEQPGRLPGAG